MIDDRQKRGKLRIHGFNCDGNWWKYAKHWIYRERGREKERKTKTTKREGRERKLPVGIPSSFEPLPNPFATFPFKLSGKGCGRESWGPTIRGLPDFDCGILISVELAASFSIDILAGWLIFFNK
jgi:hypothetical protein